MNSFIQDDMLFTQYLDNGWQCIIKLPIGNISVRFGGYGLFTNKEQPYEVWYPTEDSPIGYQTANDIWNYINEHKV